MSSKKFSLRNLVFCLVIFCCCQPVVVAQELGKSKSIPVSLEKLDGQWKLLRSGQHYLVKGAGGEGELELLKSSGGNSNRTWGVDEGTQARLDEAHRLGMSVAVGIWLEHEGPDFDYSNQANVDEQYRKVIEAIQRYKNHPAVLVWGIGNEMEGGNGENVDLWRHIEKIASEVKKIDPNHPTMTVIAEIGGGKVQAINKYCPSLDIIGINSYGGAASLPDRYRKSEGTKPYLVTEFGPIGTWEVPKNNLGAIEEKTSTAKSETYRKNAQIIAGDQELCLGSYAFLWGNKQEGTATWFGLLLADGKKTAGVDVLTELWTGQPPANRCPQIESMSLVGNSTVEPGAKIQLQLKAFDPEGKQLNVRWELMAEASSYVTGGQFQATPPTYPKNIVQSDSSSATIEMPKSGGIYRAYAYVDDGEGAAATANIPLFVSTPESKQQGLKVALPFTLYDEPGGIAAYVPTGWMGSVDAITVKEDCTTDPKSGQHCIEVKYSKNDEWGGVVWQNPPGDWGDKPGGLNVEGAKKLTFWAKGTTGEEKVKFGFGLLGKEKTYFDTAKDEMEVNLSVQWKQFTFDVSTADLTRIKTGFFWTVAGQGQPMTFYLDRIVFE